MTQRVRPLWALFSAVSMRRNHFGLLAGQGLKVRSLGIVSQLVQTAPTLDLALSDLVLNYSGEQERSQGRSWAAGTSGTTGYIPSRRRRRPSSARRGHRTV